MVSPPTKPKFKEFRRLIRYRKRVISTEPHSNLLNQGPYYEGPVRGWRWRNLLVVPVGKDADSSDFQWCFGRVHAQIMGFRSTRPDPMKPRRWVHIDPRYRGR